MVGVFADDSKIFHTLETQNDTTILQGNLSKIEYWSRTWQIKFNLEKCEATRITHARDNSKPSYFLFGKVLKTVERSKHLGIIVINNSSWSLQVQTMGRKRNQIVGLIKRTVGWKNCKCSSLLLKTLIR